MSTKRLVAVVAIVAVLTACASKPSQQQAPSPTEKVNIAVPTVIQTAIPDRPELPIYGERQRLAGDREKAVVSTVAILVAHVKALECLLVPFASNGNEYAVDCERNE